MRKTPYSGLLNSVASRGAGGVSAYQSVARGRLVPVTAFAHARRRHLHSDISGNDRRSAVCMAISSTLNFARAFFQRHSQRADVAAPPCAEQPLTNSALAISWGYFPLHAKVTAFLGSA